MTNRRITPVILCGGAGTRLWPASRDEFPKQFINLLGAQSTFQDTVERVSDRALFLPPLIVTSERYLSLVQEQLAAIGAEATILLEPSRRDSGPAIAAAAAVAARSAPDSLLLVLASDHVVKDEEAFGAAVRQAAKGAEAGFIVTFGIRPDRPATGYGYICRTEEQVVDGITKVDRFVEKPDAAAARAYIDAGYLWNSGNFLFQADTLIAEYSRFEPATMAAAERAAREATDRGNARLLNAEAFNTCRSQSIDYAVMEQSDRVAVLSVSMGWSDVGSWHAVWELSSQDESGNAAYGQAIFRNAENNFVRTDNHLVCLIGVSNLAVVATSDALLIYERTQEGAIKELVSDLKRQGHA
jgi:mannose-1-phosphate guanylyltransferase / mannose-6-phosphate isomerase